jgi:hypothetical protein
MGACARAPRPAPEFCGAALKVASFLKQRVRKSTQLPHSDFDSIFMPEIRMDSYVLRIQRYGHLEASTLIVALLYVDRVCSARRLSLTRTNVHRLFLACSVVASKWVQDVLYDNARMAKVGGVKLAELNALELRVLETLGWSAAVSEAEYSAKLQLVDAHWAKIRSGCRFAEDFHAHKHLTARHHTAPHSF